MSHEISNRRSDEMTVSLNHRCSRCLAVHAVVQQEILWDCADTERVDSCTERPQPLDLALDEGLRRGRVLTHEVRHFERLAGTDHEVTTGCWSR